MEKYAIYVALYIWRRQYGGEAANRLKWQAETGRLRHGVTISNGHQLMAFVSRKYVKNNLHRNNVIYNNVWYRRKWRRRRRHLLGVKKITMCGQ
jgi:hypothetical protein